MAGVLGSSFIYLLLAITGVLRFARETRRATVSPDWAPVTVLKPVCGLEPGLLENLQSFCDQDFTTYQVIFGVRDPKDLAIPIIEKVIGEFPDKDLSLVVNERVLGGNLKASNLANVFEMARHDIIVVADSDMRVRRDYLKAVATPFLKTERSSVRARCRRRPSRRKGSGCGNGTPMADRSGLAGHRSVAATRCVGRGP